MAIPKEIIYWAVVCDFCGGPLAVIFNLDQFIEKNNELSVRILMSFLEVEVKGDYVKGIEDFLFTSEIGAEKELTDYFLKKATHQIILIYNETLERFAKNPEEYRFEIEIDQLLYLINQKMLYGIRRIRSILKI